MFSVLFRLSLAFVAAFAPSVRAQFVPAPTDLNTTIGYTNVTVRYKQVPTGICELNPDVKSFSGYADVRSVDNSLFSRFMTYFM